MTKKRPDGKDKIKRDVSRRDFIRITGVTVVGAGAGVGILGCQGDAFENPAGQQWVVRLPLSEGYLVVDTAKCQGCHTCMLACSLVHEGAASLSLSSIQIIQNSFEKWPQDIVISQCRQCERPECVLACPRNALHIDEENGNVRRVDKSKCIGCGKCVKACPYFPQKPVVAIDPAFEGRSKSRKCDLCVDAPYLTNANGEHIAGGPSGTQACVRVCPVGAIQFTPYTPEQEGDSGYRVNLRDENWEKLGYPIDDLEDIDGGNGQDSGNGQPTP